PDGRSLRTTCADGCLRLWDLAPPDRVVLRPGPGLRSISFRPDGQVLLTADLLSVRAYDPATGKELNTLAVIKDAVRPPTVWRRAGKARLPGSGAGKALVASDAPTGRPLGPPLPLTFPWLAGNLSLHPDGHTLLLGGLRQTRQVDLVTGEARGEPVQHPRP